MEVLPAHDSETINSHKVQYKLRQQVNRVRYQRCVVSLDQLPESARPPDTKDELGGVETRDLAKVRQLHLSGVGAVALFEGGARGLVPSHTSLVLYSDGMALSGDGGAPSGEVSLLRCDGCQDASWHSCHTCYDEGST